MEKEVTVIPVQIVNKRSVSFEDNRTMTVIEGLSEVGIFEQYVSDKLGKKVADDFPRNYELVFEPAKSKNKLVFKITDIIEVEPE